MSIHFSFHRGNSCFEKKENSTFPKQVRSWSSFTSLLKSGMNNIINVNRKSRVKKLCKIVSSSSQDRAFWAQEPRSFNVWCIIRIYYYEQAGTKPDDFCRVQDWVQSQSAHSSSLLHALKILISECSLCANTNPKVRCGSGKWQWCKLNSLS